MSAMFHWKGIESGHHSEGDVDAQDEDEAKHILQERKIIFTDLKLVEGNNTSSSQEQKSASSLPRKHKARKIKNRQLMLFTKKFATMIKSGLPILKTLNMLEEQTENKNFRMVVHMILSDVESGSTLSDAFSKHPIIFDEIYINLLRAGETSGKLTIFLERLVIQIEKTEKIYSKVKSALTYPIILIIVATIVIVLMLVKVVPVFEQMFSSMGHSLPAPTMLIISMSEFLREPSQGGVLFGAIVALFMGARYMIKNNMSVRHKFHRLLLRVPLVKDVIQKSTLSKIAMIEGNLSTAGVSVLDALDITSQAVNNVIYKEALMETKKGISEGKTLSSLYMQNEIFPSTFCQMIEVGEETGNMDEMLETTAHYYEEEFDMLVDRLTELLEPFMIVFMGLTIGFIIVAMYMPIFQIGKTMMN